MDRGIITISENGTVAIPTAPIWMTQQEMCDAFNVFGCDNAACQTGRQDLL